jgi:hypothetical protein
MNLLRSRFDLRRVRLPIAIAVLLGAYYAAAEWRRTTYIRTAPDHGIRVRMSASDYTSMGDFVVTIRDVRGTFEEVGDTPEDNHRSPVELYENDVKLGPAHSTLAEIVNEGHGRYLHEAGRGHGSWTTWSSSDNTNPMTNGRTYWLVKPDK